MSELDSTSTAPATALTRDAQALPGDGHAGLPEDIRLLIRQLHGALRETRERLSTTERERDELRVELEDSRAGFAEVMSAIEERNSLRATIEKLQASISELHERLDVLHRQNGDLHRQCAAASASQGKLDDALKQRDSLRQARDAAQAQCHDLIDKVQALTDQLAEVTSERDRLAAQIGRPSTSPQS